MSDDDRDAAIKRGKSKADKQSKKKQESKGGKGKKGGKAKGGKDPAGGPTIAGHPRAAAQVRRAKGWGGLAGFALAAYLSYKAGISPDQVGIRALVAGIAGYMLAWACSVSIWRHLMMAELRAQAEAAGLAPSRGAPAGPPGPPDGGQS